MREIPSLQILCLRNVGGKACSAEDTFASTSKANSSTQSPTNSPTKDATTSTTTKRKSTDSKNTGTPAGSKEEPPKEELSMASQLLRSGLLTIRTPSIGNGSARRKQANDVDLHHPWVAVRQKMATDENNNNQDLTNTNSNRDDGLYAEYNTPALDVLQAYVDSLVELSRMDDNRLGLHFFLEWKALVEAKQSHLSSTGSTTPSQQEQPPQLQRVEEGSSTSKKRKLSSTSSSSTRTKKDNPPLGSLSLHNTIIHQETIGAMVESKMTYHLAVLDLTGVQTLTDDLLKPILTHSPHLQRLSVKNCRRLTQPTLECLSEHCPQLTSLDIGGAYNFLVQDVLEMIASLSNLKELHASGLLWNDERLLDLCQIRSWRALSLGFLLPGQVTADGLKQALITTQAKSLQSLALPFCEHLVDAALLGVLGRHLPHIITMDVRGNTSLNSLTGWYDGRATSSDGMKEVCPLFVLARFSNISKASIEDTKRIHPQQTVELSVCLDSDGVGEGIRRVERIR